MMKVKVLKRVFEEEVQTTRYGEPSLQLFSTLIVIVWLTDHPII